MRETEIVRNIRRLAATGPSNARLVQGIGDDCAIFRPRVNEDLVFTSDFVLEGRHFTLESHSAADIGHKALARSLSDLAAMGSEPLFCLVSLALPQSLTGAWLNSFYRGLLALARKNKVTLAGGDLSRFDKVVADVICCGRVPRGKALLRSGARPGDAIYVTGKLGASARGFAMQSGNAFRCHLRPEPRISAGLALRRLRVTACMDLSDGLSLDLIRLCEESHVSAQIDSTLPVARGATIQQALSGGEDYELLFTASSEAKIPHKIGSLPVTRIGIITPKHAGQVFFEGQPLAPGGFDHFA